MIVVFSVSGARGAELCSRWLTGNLEISGGSLADEYGTVLVENPSYGSTRAGGRRSILDLATRKEIEFQRHPDAFPISRNKKFSKILLIESVGRFLQGQGRFLIVNSHGDILQEFSPPPFLSPAEIAELKGGLFNEESTAILFTTLKGVYIFDLLKKNWEHLFSVSPSEGEFTWFYEKKWVRAFWKQNRILVGLGPDPKQNHKSHYFVLQRGKPHEPLYDRWIAGGGNLIHGRFLIGFTNSFGSIPHIDLWDIFENRSVEIILPIDGDQRKLLKANFFEGPLGGIGVAIGGEGFIGIYDFNGHLQQKKHIPFFSAVKSIVGSRKLLIKDGKSGLSYLFDPRNGDKLFLPALLSNVLVSENSLVIKINDRLYTQSVANQLMEESLIALKLDSECMDSINIMNRSSSAIQQNMGFNSLIALSALEGQIPGVSSEILRTQFQNQSFSKETLLSYLNRFSLLFGAPLLGSENRKQSAWLWYLGAFGKKLHFLSDEQKEFYLDQLAIQISTMVSLNISDNLSRVPQSKIANIVLEMAKPFFGKPWSSKTDISMVQVGGDVVPVILGTTPIDGDEATRTDFGFSAKELPPLKLSETEIQKFDYIWQVNNKKWRAEGQAKLVNLQNLINRAPSINYSNLWRDGKLAGAIILSSNLQDGYESLVRNMVSHFKKQGFEFGPEELKFPKNSSGFIDSISKAYLFPKNVQKVRDGKSWMKSMIEVNELDYWVKEAHAAGVDIVIQLANSNLLLRGVRNLRGGATEEIYLLYPDEKSARPQSKDSVINDSDFSNWLRKRESGGGTDLIYVNASCWSAWRAFQELVAVKSPLLVELPTVKGSWTFNLKANNHERMLIDLIRRGATYEEMRTQLDALPGIENPYIFPNEPEYQEQIWSRMGAALDVDVYLHPANE